jgi:hypothetical protein
MTRKKKPPEKAIYAAENTIPPDFLEFLTRHGIPVIISSLLPEGKLFFVDRAQLTELPSERARQFDQMKTLVERGEYPHVTLRLDRPKGG